MAVVDAALPVDRLPGITRQDAANSVERMAADPEGTLVAVADDRSSATARRVTTP